jgi:hypothetical protein
MKKTFLCLVLGLLTLNTANASVQSARFAGDLVLAGDRAPASLKKNKKPKALKHKKSSHFKATRAQKKLNAENMKPVIFPEKIKDNSTSYEDFVRIVPRDIHNSDSPVYVATKFGDQVMQNFLNSPQVQSSQVGRTANTVQNAMKADVSLGATPSASDPKGVNHKLSFQYMALQAQARLKYSGWTNAAYSHDAKAKQSDVEVSEKIFKNKDLVLNYTKNETEVRNSVGVRWSW